MKKKRHLMILKLITENPISTQEELLKLLFENGFDVTQATVSRDIKELKLIKTTDSKGRYRYSVPEENHTDSSKKYSSVISSSVVDVKNAGNIVCIRCLTGTAQAVCFIIDEQKSEKIIGTLAGDDTIFILCANEQDAKDVCTNINQLAVTE